MESIMRNMLQYLTAKLIHEGGVKGLFDHVRNLLTATLIIAAGSYAIRQAAVIQFFGVMDVELAGYAVVVIGVMLAGLSASDGLYQLKKQQWHIGFRVAAIGMYLFGAMRIVQFLVMLRNS